MTTETPQFEAKRFGFHFQVFPDRVEVREKVGFKNKSATILVRQITGVTVDGIGGSKLKIATAGESYEYTIGRQAEQAKAAILAHLQP